MKMNGMRLAILGGAVALGCTGTVFAQTTGDTMAQDKTFVTMAAEGSETEIQASQMALKKSKNDDVKAYAQKMIDDHTKLMSDMKPFADQMSVKVPVKLTTVHQEQASRLKAKSGSSFDQEYVKDMVADHHKDLADFTHEMNTTSNADLKATVTSGRDVIKEHTDMIDAMAQKMNLPVPPTPADPAM